MKPEEKKRIADLYSSRLKSQKSPHEVVGWGSKESQDLRFKVLTEIGSVENSSILDVGCGLADLYTSLVKRGLKPKYYLGVDISEPLVVQARQAIGDNSLAEAKCIDILQDDVNAKFDYVFCSGALNLKIDDNWGHTERMLKRMYDLSIKGMACNFLSTYVDFSHEKDYHHSPEKVFTFSRQLTKKVALRHDYPLYEFTIYLYKE